MIKPAAPNHRKSTRWMTYDVVIIGGGPAGAALGAYLGMAGVSCVILEKKKFPRPHVGESLVPSSTRVFKELDFLETMETEGFPRKFGAVWTAPRSTRVYSHDWEGMSDEYRVQVAFSEREQPGVDQNYTYHVDRARFDECLLKHAKQKGAEVKEECRVKAYRISNDGVEVETTDGTIRAEVMVDASGRSTFIGRKEGWLKKDPHFDQCALHTWFKGYDRTGDFADHIVIHFLEDRNSWVWQIPISQEVTSFGIVTQKTSFVKSASEHESFFWDKVASRPELEAKLRSAERVRPFKAEGDYSYAMTQMTADRVLLIGDAARFVDPIFSSGVSVALNSARKAAECLIQSVGTRNFSRSAFSEYERYMETGCRNWHAFISLYYRLNVVFTYFVEQPRYRQDVLKFLQGDVFDDDEPELLKAMRKLVSEVEANPKHPLYEGLGTLKFDMSG